MSIKLGRATQKDFNGLMFLVIGDGETTTVNADLSKPPFLVDFQGFYPSSAVVTAVGQAGVTATATLDEPIMHLTFSEPIEVGMTDVTVEFQYDGV